MERKKFLGQNFLRDKRTLEEMVRVADVIKKDVVLEVGPGEGTLTEALALRAKKVIAVEKDRDLIAALKNKFRDKKNVEIIEGDILKVSSFFAKKTGKYKVVANIPYYITSHLLKLFLSDADVKPSLMVLMIQKEVAERVVAKDGRESLLSLSVKSYGHPEFVRRISKNLFSPPPKVDSAILKISGISDDFFKKNKLDEKVFFETLRSAFQKKRKMLRQSVGKKVNLPEKYKTARPETLSLEDWLKILV